MSEKSEEFTRTKEIFVKVSASSLFYSTDYSRQEIGKFLI